MKAVFFNNGRKIEYTQVPRIAYGGILKTPWRTTLEMLNERMETKQGTCQNCGGYEWDFLPYKTRKQGGKPYIKCMNCGYVSHL